MSQSPDASTMPEESGGRRLALVVAVTDYLDPALRRLRAPAGDAADLRDLLADPEIGRFSVTSVINERAQQIRLAIEDFLADRRPEDVLLVYLSCHGLVDLRRRLYFAARDTLKNRLASSGVEAHWLLEQLEDCRARRQVVILDCCFSGAFAQGSKGDDDLGIGERLVGEGRGRVVLTASRGTEYSFEGEPLQGEDTARGSVFTSALVKGIRSGAADADADGYISVDDAYTYAFDQVREAGGSQTPQRWLYGAEGSILLARTPRAATSEPVADLPPAAPGAPRDVVPTPAPAAVEPPHPPASVPARAGSRLSARRLAYAALAVLLLAGAVLAGVLLTRDAPESSTDGASRAAVTRTGKTSGTIRATAPWRFVIRDLIEGNDIGCDVTLTPTASGEPRQWLDLYGTHRSYQIAESGTFRYDVSDPACVIVAVAGAGRTKIPFNFRTGIGDTAAFTTSGKVRVEARDFAGNTSCDPELHAVGDGRVLDLGTIPEGSQRPVTLDPAGEDPVYIASPDCGIAVSATR
jgi:hypothetical protein